MSVTIKPIGRVVMILFSQSYQLHPLFLKGNQKIISWPIEVYPFLEPKT
jgi:hypothetical protein